MSRGYKVIHLSPAESQMLGQLLSTLLLSKGVRKLDRRDGAQWGLVELLRDKMETDNLLELVERIRSRRGPGLSQATLAALTGYTREVICRLLKKHRQEAQGDAAPGMGS